MINLLINVPDFTENERGETKFGGRPSSPDGGFQWPTCKACHGNMQFLGQIRTKSPESDRGRLLLLFMCQNDPGLCEEWDANAGGNKVIAVDDEALHLIEPPAAGEVLRPTLNGASVVTFAAADYDAAREGWAAANNRRGREVLGQMGGNPAWIQQDETPTCDLCGAVMDFVAQLEQGPEAGTEMNCGGGGSAYVFSCRSHDVSAKMLWQC